MLRELVAWLSDPDLDHRARVVTGDPGSGKSAVLVRLVTLAEPEFRRRLPQSVLTGIPAGTVPPVGIVDVAIHARNKTLIDMLHRLTTAVGSDEPAAGTSLPTPEEQVNRLVNQLLSQQRQRVVVLDALDEAADPDQLVTQLLQPLLDNAPGSGLRLLVGTRRPLETLGKRIVILNLDDPEYLNEADLVEYVTRVLLAEHDPDQATPYRGRRKLADQLARQLLVAPRSPF